MQLHLRCCSSAEGGSAEGAAHGLLNAKSHWLGSFLGLGGIVWSKVAQ
jgi:hypothetical protein